MTALTAPLLRGWRCLTAPSILHSAYATTRSSGEKEDLKNTMVPETASPSAKKVSVVGAGQVGMATAFSLLTQNVTCNVTLIDSRGQRVSGEVLDIDRGSVFLPSEVRIKGSSRYEDTENSEICVLATAADRTWNEKQEEIMQRNAIVFKNTIPKLLKYSPNTTLVVVSQPVDVMSHVAWRVSGLPANRVLGSGTSADSAQFRTLIARRLGLSVADVHAWIVGEQGLRAIPVWSGVSAAGVRLRDLLPHLGTENDKEKWGDMAKDAVNNGQEIIALKGHSSWASALSISAICRALLCDTKDVYSVSTLVKGQHGVQKEVFLSLPCVLHRSGVQSIVNQELNEEEAQQFQRSAERVFHAQRTLLL